MPGGRTGRALQTAAVASTAGACFFAPFDQQAPPEADSTRRPAVASPAPLTPVTRPRRIRVAARQEGKKKTPGVKCGPRASERWTLSREAGINNGR
jgi:hypothetical protein